MRWLRRLLRRRRRAEAQLLDVIVNGWSPTHRVPDTIPEDWA